MPQGSQMNDDGKDKPPKSNIDPKGYARTVLEHCGEIRVKDQKVVTTERGFGFLRKLTNM